MPCCCTSPTHAHQLTTSSWRCCSDAHAGYFSATQSHDHKLDYDGFRAVLAAMAERMYTGTSGASPLARFVEFYLVSTRGGTRTA